MNNIFHEGELHFQEIKGVRSESNALSSMIKDYIPPIAKNFLEELNFCIIAVSTKDIKLHTFLVFDINSFIKIIDEKNISIDLKNSSLNFDKSFYLEKIDIGFLGLDFETKKRLRLNGKGKVLNKTLEIEINQIYSNCPKYISTMQMSKQLKPKKNQNIEKFDFLNSEIIDLISNSNSFFLSTSYKNSIDVSYKGGESGFVSILNLKQIQYKDFPGNNLFNSLGNIYKNSFLNMIFVDFKLGDIYLIKANGYIDESNFKELIININCNEIYIYRNCFLLDYKDI